MREAKELETWPIPGQDRAGYAPMFLCIAMNFMCVRMYKISATIMRFSLCRRGYKISVM